MTILPVRAFGGGVVLEGSPDTETGAELEAADEFDIGARGSLVLGSTVTDWVQLLGAGVGVPRLCAIASVKEDFSGTSLAVGGLDKSGLHTLILVDRNALPLSAVPAWRVLGLSVPLPTTDPQVTIVSFPYRTAETIAGTPYNNQNQVFVNYGSREGTAATSGPGLYRVTLYDAAGVATLGLVSIDQFDALGTGPRSEEFPGGTKGKQLRFRGIFKYGPLLCGFGHGAASGGAANGDNRLMFSNIAKPLKWGFDDQAAAGNRDYRDEAAVMIGASGEIIRAGLEWRGRAWLGTNREIHWLSGYGIDSFVTDGTRSAFRQNVIGVHAMIEGPDTLLHGVGTQGHWVFDGDEFALVGRKLVDFSGRSTGWWDLITQTNQDLVWMLRDDTAQQVWIVIPRCNATLGYGDGTDSVVIKFDTRTQGYTRQVYLGRRLSAGCFIARDSGLPEMRAIGDELAATYHLMRYGYRATVVDDAPLPVGAPRAAVTRAPAGPEGTATVTWADLTLGWTAAALPLAFDVELKVDGAVRDTVRLTIGPAAPPAPATGEVWLDTSGADANLGTATAGALVAAEADYAEKVWNGRSWVVIGGGMKGQRATIAVPFLAGLGTRFTATITQVAASGRYQLEAFAFDAERGAS